MCYMCVITRIFEIILMAAGVMMFLMIGYRVMNNIYKEKNKKGE